MPPEDRISLTLPISWHMGQALLFGVAFLVAVVLVYVAMPSTERRAKVWEFESLDFLKVLAIVLAPVWVWLIAHIIWSLWALAVDFDPNGQDADIRWHALAFVGLITAMGALVSAPLALIRVWTTERQTRTAEQGHITDRISKAVEQLGAEKTVKRDGEAERTVPNIEVRIGGLLSLERIAQDSTAYDKGRDHVRVMEILCAYVRENAPARAASISLREEWERAPQGEEPGIPTITFEEFCADHGIEDYEDPEDYFGPKATVKWAELLRAPREDIALAVKIIGRRDAEQRAVEARWGPEVEPTAEWVFDIPCPELAEPPDGKAHGKEKLAAYKVELDAWIQRIEGYRGFRPDLRYCNLQSADLIKLTLSGAQLAGARLDGTAPEAARLQGATLWRARLQAAYLEGARLEGANLWQAWLQGAILRQARLQEVDLEGALLQGADLEAARLEGAYFGGARLDETTSFQAALLGFAAWKDVDLSSATLSAEQIHATFGDGSVTLPKGIARPAHWPDWDMPRYGDPGFHAEWQKWQADPDAYVPPPKPAPAPGDD